MIERFSPIPGQVDRPSPDTLSTNGQSQPASSGAAILLIDDNPAVALALAITMRLAGHRLDVANAPDDACSRLAVGRYDAILLDLNFTAGRTGGEEGLALLTRIMTDDPTACIIVITAHSGIRIAIAAMQAGARDFVTKPWRNADLIAKVTAAITRDPVFPRSAATPATGGTVARLIGDSTAMTRVRAMIQRVAPTSAGIVVTGAPGTGRHLVASAIHAASLGAATPADRVDLRDADAWRRLDDPSATVILRYPDRLNAVAQDRLLDRLPPAIRCIAVADAVADLTPALRRRIATIEIAVPPLSDRERDALLLARHFARLAAEDHARPAPRLTPAAETAILSTVWPDAVRGLALAIERAVLLSDDGIIDAAALALPNAVALAIPVPSTAAQPMVSFDLVDTERAVIAAALREHHHNVSHAATALGLSRGALYRRMARHGL